MDLIAALNDRVGQQLSGASGVETFAFLWVGGLLASLLPCVYPIYPITASILSARTSKLGKWIHPLSYYLGLAAIYFGFGLVASITGGAFNEVLRLPLANLGIGVLLLLLALATMGYLDFPVLSVEGERGTGVAGTFLMGSAAGLLSSACVGPVVVSILVGVATHTGGVSLGTVLVAAAKLLCFGLGLGVPILAVGLFGLTLPKGGKWMVYVQWAFGLLIAGFAWGYAEKGLSGYGFSDEVSNAIALGALLVLVASYFLQRGDGLLVTERTKRALLMLAGIVGTFVMGRHILSTPSARATSGHQATSPANPLTEEHGSLTWYLDKRAAYEAAARSGKPVFIDFFGSWCTNCKAFEERTVSDKKLSAALEQAVLLKVYDTSPQFQEYKSDPRFPELRVGLPFFVITDPKGNLLYKTNDFTKTDEMALFLSG